ncbi:hypothetical protein JW964_00655, partial [candidate division KSB1 bacterium]|nr:hypothetical protein [candidate division KSB1 bacterium]
MPFLSKTMECFLLDHELLKHRNFKMEVLVLKSLFTLTTLITLFFLSPQSGYSQEGWTVVRQPQFDDLNTVHFTDSEHGWLTEGNKILRTTDGGQTWQEKLHITELHSIEKVFFIDSWRGWALGQHAAKIWYTRTGGNQWEAREVDSSCNVLLDVFFINHQSGWAVGDSGAILHTTDGGRNWTRQAVGFMQCRFTSVTFVNADTGWAVGIQRTPEQDTTGTIIYTHDGGASWHQHSVEIDGPLFDVQFANASHGWLGGGDGTLLHTNDGGKTWLRQNPETYQDLRSLCFVSENEGWVIGSHGAIRHT